MVSISPTLKPKIGEAAMCLVSTAPLFEEPVRSSTRASELIFGEVVELLNVETEWAHVRSQFDQTIGYCLADNLSLDVQSATHRVIPNYSLAYGSPNFKMNPVCSLPRNSRVEIQGTSLSEWPKDPPVTICMAKGIGWLTCGSISPVDRVDADFFSVCQDYMGAPYLWGGRTYSGIDCSGLVQTAADASGIQLPRSTEQQVSDHQLYSLDPDIENLQTGDLIYIEGHVLIYSSNGDCVHADSISMSVIEEPIKTALKKRGKSFGSDTKVRRLPTPNRRSA